MLRFLVAHLGGLKRYLIAYIFLGIAASLVTIVPPIFVERLIDVALPRHDLRLAVILSGGMLLAAIASTIISSLSGRAATIATVRYCARLRSVLFARIAHWSLDVVHSQITGDVLTRLTNDVESISGLISQAGQIVFIIAGASSAIIGMLELSPMLGLLAVALTLLTLPLFIRSQRRFTEQNLVSMESYSDMMNFLQSKLSFESAITRKVFGAERIEQAQFSNVLAERSAVEISLGALRSTFYACLAGVKAVETAIIWVIGAIDVAENHLAIGRLVGLVSLSVILQSNLNSLTGCFEAIGRLLANVRRVNDVVSLPSEIEEDAGPPDQNQLDGNIILRDASFYASNDRRIIQGATAVIPSGSRVAIIGPSGAGKTTLAHLIAGLRRCRHGVILIDGRNVGVLSRRVLCRTVGYVSHQSTFFDGSIIDNLRYASPSATMAELITAARKARIHETIESLPLGYGTLMGQNGWLPSAGERQRLALTRIFLRDPSILILDEATNSLDAESQTLVRQAIDEAMRGRTCLTISHSPSDAQDATLILAIESDGSVTVGTHETLRGTSKSYTTLIDGAAEPEPREVVGVD